MISNPYSFCRLHMSLSTPIHSSNISSKITTVLPRWTIHTADALQIGPMTGVLMKMKKMRFRRCLHSLSKSMIQEHHLDVRTGQLKTWSTSILNGRHLSAREIHMPNMTNRPKNKSTKNQTKPKNNPQIKNNSTAPPNASTIMFFIVFVLTPRPLFCPATSLALVKVRLCAQELNPSARSIHHIVICQSISVNNQYEFVV